VTGIFNIFAYCDLYRAVASQPLIGRIKRIEEKVRKPPSDSSRQPVEVSILGPLRFEFSDQCVRVFRNDFHFTTTKTGFSPSTRSFKLVEVCGGELGLKLVGA
jgi:hypothetical protein